MARPLRILMIASEVESLARTGGLGDVVEALSLAVAERGAHVAVVTPLYGVTKLPKNTQRWADPVLARWGWGAFDQRRVSVVELATTRFPSNGSRRTCLLDDPGLYARRGIYGDSSGTFGDNALRFAVMSRAALEIGSRIWDGGPDIVHAHDWHAAFAVLYGKLVMGRAWAQKSFVFTIHNLAFQGVLDESALDQLHLPREAWKPEILWHDGRVNLMKGATALADRITTVSPTYAREIRTREGGMGLDVHLSAHADRLVGIVNGIDTARFDPATDDDVACRYDRETFPLGREECKRALLEEMGLRPGNGPLFSIVSRFTWQKGLDLLVPQIDRILAADGRLLFLGQGDVGIEELLAAAAHRFPGKVAVRIAFDPPLSRRVYSASDFFFVPSRFEPCGLTQLYAMRYGAVPIVTDVGGLHDTVAPLSPDASTGVGFVARTADEAGMAAVTDAAIELFGRPSDLRKVVRRAMSGDVSWRGPGQAYMSLYEGLRLPRDRA